MVGEAIDPGKIFGNVGQGAMGESYRAEGTCLKREVAIKILLEPCWGE